MDEAWIAVVGAVVGGSLTGVVALLQSRMQHRSELARVAAERHHTEQDRRRAELVKVYTRYQLAADELENSIRDLSISGRESFEEAQNKYDIACQVLNLVAPAATAAAAMQQRRLFNQLARQGVDGIYRHEQSIAAIRSAATPVLEAMRSDLGSTGEGATIP